MATTTFVDNATVIEAEWLNDVNTIAYTGTFTGPVTALRLIAHGTGGLIGNSAVGIDSLLSITLGQSNTATGHSSIYSNTVGSNNTAMGVQSLYDTTGGSNNTAIGYDAGRGITTGNGNTVLGANVPFLAGALTNNIILTSGDGVVKYQHNGFAGFIRQVAPTAINATATATLAELLTQIITSTSAAPTTITLPTGTLMDGALISSLDMAFDWVIINTGPNTVTVAAGVDHTVVGSMAVAAATSANFRSRRTASNVWVTYRI